MGRCAVELDERSPVTPRLVDLDKHSGPSGGQMHLRRVLGLRRHPVAIVLKKEFVADPDLPGVVRAEMRVHVLFDRAFDLAIQVCQDLGVRAEIADEIDVVGLPNAQFEPNLGAVGQANTRIRAHPSFSLATQRGEEVGVVSGTARAVALGSGEVGAREHARDEPRRNGNRLAVVRDERHRRIVADCADGSRTSE